MRSLHRYDEEFVWLLANISIGSSSNKSCHDRRERGADLRDREGSPHVSANRTRVPCEGRDANFYAIWLISKHMGFAFEGRHGLQNLALKLDRHVTKAASEHFAAPTQARLAERGAGKV